MAEYIARVSCGGGQMRITIPKLVIRGLKWEGVSYVILEENKDGTLTIRRFKGDESLKSDNKRSGSGSD